MNKFSSIFGQIPQIFSKVEFYRAVIETGAEKGAKGFTCCPVFNTGHVVLSIRTGTLIKGDMRRVISGEVIVASEKI